MADIFSKATGTYERDKKYNEELDRGTADLIGGAGRWLDGKKDAVKNGIKDKVSNAAKDAARKAREKALTGKLTPVRPNGQRYQPGQWGSQGKAATTLTTKQTQALTGKAPVQGITKENLKPAKGQTAKITLQKGPIGNDRSIWGCPVGQGNKTAAPRSAQNVPAHRGSKTPDARRRDYPNYPPKKPDYPGYPGNKGASGLTKQGSVSRDRSLAGRPVGGQKPIGNDRSIWGRPVGGKKPIGQDRSTIGRPKGIAKANVQPRHNAKHSVRNKSGKNRVQQNHRPQTCDMSRNSGRSQSRNQHQNRNKHQGQKVRMHNNRSSGRRG